MFTPLLLICMSDMSLCWGQSSGELFKKYDDCIQHIGLGIELFEGQGNVVMDYQCVKWEPRQPT